MKFVGVFTETKVKALIKRRIKKGKYEFDCDMDRFDKMSIHEINACFKYGYIEQLYLNEILD